MASETLNTLPKQYVNGFDYDFNIV